MEILTGLETPEEIRLAGRHATCARADPIDRRRWPSSGRPARRRSVWLRIGALAFALFDVAGLVVGAAPHPFLKTSGPDLRNDYGRGDVVPLRGANLGSWLLLEPWMCPMDSSGTSLTPTIVWETLAGSTNTVTNLNGAWQFTVTNTAPQRFYRSAVVVP
jgi:hypothetical protein